METYELYEFWLSRLAGIGLKKQKILLDFATPQEIFEMSSTELMTVEGISDEDIRTIVSNRNLDKLIQELEKTNQNGVRFIGRSNEQFPDKLKEIYDAPLGLYYKGRIDKLNNNQKIIAIVGSRGCTNYGITMAERLGKTLSEAGVAVISGMARGIDTYAHRGCLKGKAPTYAVLAGGVDVCYPKENLELYNEICNTGGILSEYPLGLQPKPQLFPVRNRIISGIADAVVVVEARLKSGSLITADMALEQNKPIYVIPGRIGDPLSEGCLWLAKQGAQVLADFDDLLSDLGIEPQEKSIQENFQISLAPTEKMLYSLMCLFPKNLNTLIEESRLEPQQVTTALLGLELKGLIREVGCHYYMKR